MSAQAAQREAHSCKLSQRMENSSEVGSCANRLESKVSQEEAKATGLQAIAPAMVVGARVEHGKHGLGVVQHIFGAELDPKHVKVKVAFDNGQTHEFKGAPNPNP